MSASLSVDTSRVHEMLVALQTDDKQTKQIIQKYFREAMKPIQDEAKRNLGHIRTKNSGTISLHGFSRYVRSKTQIGKGSWQGGEVYYLDKSKGSRSFILRFFEHGTGANYHPKGARKKGYHGQSLPASWWFSSAADNQTQGAIDKLNGMVEELIKRAEK